jgi:hypothetical protein
MTAMIGAGKKETNNTFTGILMGEVSNKTSDSSIQSSPLGRHSGIGLYGYQGGA